MVVANHAIFRRAGMDTILALTSPADFVDVSIPTYRRPSNLTPGGDGPACLRGRSIRGFFSGLWVRTVASSLDLLGLPQIVRNIT